MVVVVFFARLCLYGLYLSEESLVNYETFSPQITLHVSRNGQQQFYSV